MKTLKFAIASLALGTLLAPAEASLLLRGGNNDMVYDTATGLTWVRNASLGGLRSWADAKVWAENLEFGGRNDWRLPGLTPVDGVALNLDFSDDGSTDSGYNNSGLNSELGFLFYNSLGNNAFDGLTETGPFQNLAAYAYWTGTASPYDGEAMHFFTAFGDQGSSSTDNLYYAWAVRVGDVPEPQSAALALAGLAALSLVRRRHSSSNNGR